MGKTEIFLGNNKESILFAVSGGCWEPEKYAWLDRSGRGSLNIKYHESLDVQ